MNLRIGHTPTADDAYMLYGLFGGLVGSKIKYTPATASQPELNNQAACGDLDVTMLSVGAYPLLKERYEILSAGASFGKSSGPVVVTRANDRKTLDRMVVAIPGATTTAYAMLQMYAPQTRTRVLPLNKLLPALEAGLADAALLIHEEFVNARHNGGLHVLADLGKWWHRTHGLPSPATVCAIKRELPAEVKKTVEADIAASVRYAFANHDTVFEAAMKSAGDAHRDVIEKFIDQYVNELSVDMGLQGRKALEEFFSKICELGIV
ncbi:MAG TPA: hypothetical protein PKK48_04030 [Phycisphaerae bacterium]|nr:hypothetical protein [Phycisphaerae bacterium]HPS53070.1 hypothetical protein [Phycisphaerae bacterium]